MAATRNLYTRGLKISVRRGVEGPDQEETTSILVGVRGGGGECVPGGNLPQTLANFQVSLGALRNT